MKSVQEANQKSLSERMVNDTDLLGFEDWVKKVIFMLVASFFDTNPTFGSTAGGNRVSLSAAVFSIVVTPHAGRWT